MDITYSDALELTSDTELWETLSAGQRILSLQAIEDHVADEQGRIACDVSAQWLAPVEGGVEMGHYEPEGMRIVVNAAQLCSSPRQGASPGALVRTVLHEGRHAYQDQAVRGVIACDPDVSAKWSKNMREYVSFEENPKRYWSQPVEADARSYAEGRMEAMASERCVTIAVGDKTDTQKKDTLPSARADSPKAAFIRQTSDRRTFDGLPLVADFRTTHSKGEGSDTFLPNETPSQIGCEGYGRGR